MSQLVFGTTSQEDPLHAHIPRHVHRKKMHKLKQRMEKEHAGKLAEIELRQEEAQAALERKTALEKVKVAERHQQKLRQLHNRFQSRLQEKEREARGTIAALTHFIYMAVTAPRCIID
jgi:hypothetical protein